MIKTIFYRIVFVLCYIFRVRIVTNFRHFGYGHQISEGQYLMEITRNKFYFLICDISYGKPANEYLHSCLAKKVLFISDKKKAKIIKELSVYESICINIGFALDKNEDTSLLTDLEKINRQIRSWKTVYMPKMRKIDNIKKEDLYFYNFSNNDINHFKKTFCDYNLLNGQKYICMHLRADRGYHIGRSAEVLAYEDSIKYLNSQNLFVVIFGLKDEIFSKNLNILYYNNFKEQSPIFDIMLYAYQEFCIGVQSGPFRLATLLTKPLLTTNCPVWTTITFQRHEIILPKKVLNRKGEMVSLNEYLEKKLLGLAYDINIEGYQLVDNNSDEILEATKEIYGFYSNQISQNTYPNFQKRFAEAANNTVGFESIGYISFAFIKKYKNFLFPDIRNKDD